MPSDIKRCPKCNTPTDLGALECRQCHYAFRMVVMGARPYETEFEADSSQQRGSQGQFVPPPIIIDRNASAVKKRGFHMRRHHWNLLGVLIACLFLLYTMNMLRDIVRETVRASQPDYISESRQPPPPPFAPQTRTVSLQTPVQEHRYLHKSPGVENTRLGGVPPGVLRTQYAVLQAFSSAGRSAEGSIGG